MRLETASPAEVAANANHRMDFRDLAVAFDYRPQLDTLPTFPNESKRLQAKGFLSGTDLYKIAHWKSPRPAGRVKQNAESDVRRITRAAFELASRRDLPPSVPVAVLTILEGVRVPTASAILTVWDPQRFGIIDVNAWSSLFNYRRVRTRQFEVVEYDRYMAILRELKRITRLTPREIDMALWVWWTKKRKARS